MGQQEGIFSLYRGFSISLFSIPVFNTIYFPIYEIVKNRLKQNFEWHENEVKLYSSSAAVAGTLCNFITNPLWVVRTRMQSEIFDNGCHEHFKQKYNHGVLSIYKNIYTLAKTEGVRALYKGFSATMMGILHPIIFFPAYEKLKIYFKKNYDTDSQNLSAKYIVVSSILAKVFSSVFSYPHEVLRSRLQYFKE